MYGITGSTGEQESGMPGKRGDGTGISAERYALSHSFDSSECSNCFI